MGLVQTGVYVRELVLVGLVQTGVYVREAGAGGFVSDWCLCERELVLVGWFRLVFM